MIFEKGRHTNYDFYLNNIKLEVVTSFKYLGIHFSKTEIGFGHRRDLLNMLPMLCTIYFQFLIRQNYRILIM